MKKFYANKFNYLDETNSFKDSITKTDRKEMENLNSLIAIKEIIFTKIYPQK